MHAPLRFQMSRQLCFGDGVLTQLAEAVRQLGGRRVLLVTDPGLMAAGIATRVEQQLQAGGLDYRIFDGVEPDPHLEIVEACHAELRAAGADLLIGLGGGSAIDIAKVVAVLATNSGSVQDLIGIDQVAHAGLPLIAMPTTAGTGSEVTPIAVLSDKSAQLKKGIVSEHLYPSLALVDPELTHSLPPAITAATGVDALTHAIEAYTNKYAQPFVDTFALQAVRLIGRWLRPAVARGADQSARYHMALGSLYGGMCLGSVNTAAVHALAYPLGGTYNVPHGVANALLLPYVMRFNLIADYDKFGKLAVALGERIDGLSGCQAAEAAVTAVQRLCRDIGIVSRLRELDIPESAIPSMAEAAMQVTRLLRNNPRAVRQVDAEAIYRAAW
jgi:alcohol dehydrogenase